MRSTSSSESSASTRQVCPTKLAVVGTIDRAGCGNCGRLGSKYFVHDQHRWRDLDAATSSNSSDAVLDNDLLDGPIAHHCETSRQLPEEVAHDHRASVVAHPDAATCQVPGDLDLFSITHRDGQPANEVVARRTFGLGQGSERRQPRFVIMLGVVNGPHFGRRSDWVGWSWADRVGPATSMGAAQIQRSFSRLEWAGRGGLCVPRAWKVS